MNQQSECPVCHSARLILGNVRSADDGRRPLFKPEALRTKFTVNTPGHLTVEHPSSVCLDCGLVMAHTNPEKARKCIATLGTEELKQQV
jgi:hypothetical protein